MQCTPLHALTLQHLGTMVEWLVAWATAEAARQSAVPDVDNVQLSADAVKCQGLARQTHSALKTLQNAIPTKKAAKFPTINDPCRVGLRQCSAAAASQPSWHLPTRQAWCLCCVVSRCSVLRCTTQCHTRVAQLQPSTQTSPVLNPQPSTPQDRPQTFQGRVLSQPDLDCTPKHACS